MSPFLKNFQRFLILSFSAASVALVVIGINRTKNTPLPAAPVIPGQDMVSTTVSNTPTPPSASGNTPAGSATFKGKTYQTPWGNVVAGITVTNGKITEVTMPEVPPSPPSEYAQSYLVQQAMTAGSANIQGVSGATYTSIAFKSSLEDAIVQASARGQSVILSTPAKSSATTLRSNKPSVPRRYRGDDEWDD